MIKVMHCISDTNFGGAGRVLINYLNYFNDNVFDIVVVLPKGSALIEYLSLRNYRVIELDGLYDRSFHRDDLKKLKKLIKLENPDIVHSHGALSARMAAKCCHKKVVYTRHSVFDLPAWQTSVPGKWLLGGINNYYADCILAVSPAAKTLLVDSGTDPKKIDVIYNGVEKLEQFNDDKKRQIKKQFGLGESDFVCTIMARLEAVKGHEYILRAAQMIKSSGVLGTKILIAGRGGIEESLKKLAHDLDVEDVVHFIGFIKEVPELLAITDVQLNASYGTEATSMALLEGFSLGVPAIVSDFGGNPYVVSHEENGLIFPKKDAGALADAILRLQNDADLYNKVSEGALNSFYEKFTAEKMTLDIEGVYNKLMGM